ncbi:MAG: YaiI/YqxD family protein [Gammaproteobacteria bacterium]|nr:YaiI/YqxD family protein [Gammaproteobacteria bacterium]
MKIWVDGDACPVVIRDVLCKAAERTATTTTFVANQAVPIPRSKCIRSIQVASGYDAADNEIVARLEAGDLVITSDIPLASDAIEKGAMVLSPRGEIYDADNIRARLTMRDFMESLRASGVDSGGPPPLSQADRKTFAGHLDKWLQNVVQN